MVVFLGDFNYRLDGITYDEARDMVSQRSFDWLRERDQLRAEMKAGNVFQGMREGPIRFPPTYKFQRNQPGLSGILFYSLSTFQLEKPIFVTWDVLFLCASQLIYTEYFRVELVPPTPCRL